MSAVELNELLKEFNFKMPLYVRWSDLDEVGHANNANYLTYIEESRIHYFSKAVNWDWKKMGIILANVNINYIRPLFYPENTFIYMRVNKIGTKSVETEHVIVVEKNGTTAGAATEIELVSRATTVLVVYDYKTNTSIPMPQDLRVQFEKFEKRTL